MKLSVAIMAIDEREHLPGCIESAAALIEPPDGELVIVLDDRATPEVEKIARNATDRVYRNHFENFSRQRNFALAQTRGDWVLFIDPDERLTRTLVAEIKAVLNRDDPSGPQGYWLPRRTYMFGLEVRHAGWWPDYQLRLMRRAVAKYDEDRAVHELPLIAEERQARLQEPLIHYNYDTWRQFTAKQRLYTAHEAQAQYTAGAKARPRNFVLQPLREFRRRFITLEGWRDGALGLLLALALAYYNFTMYVRLARLGRPG